jgi:hypothetical protein
MEHRGTQGAVGGKGVRGCGGLRGEGGKSGPLPPKSFQDLLIKMQQNPK